MEGSRDDTHLGGECRPRKTRSGRNLTRWRHRDRGSQKGHRHPCISDGVNGHQKGPNTDKHTNNPDASSVCNLPRKVATPSQNEAGHWRPGETAHLPEVSLFERFLSRARGVRPNRSTRTRRGLARRGGPTYSVIESFRDFWGCPIADLHYRCSESVRGISARGVRTRARSPYMSTQGVLK